MSSHKKIFQCHVCSKQYDKKFNFEYHVAHHSDHRPFICDVQGCTSSYKTKADLRQHQKLHENSLGIIFTCNDCPGLHFNNSANLNIHRKQVHHSKLTQESWCEICRRYFTSIKSHRDIVHKKIRIYVCDMDGKRFGRMHGLKRHIQAVHLGLAPFSCQQCHKSFKESGALKKHMKRHSRGFRKIVQHRKPQVAPENWEPDEIFVTEKTRYNCSCCSSNFFSLKSLQKHQTESHANAKFICDICKLRFVSKFSVSQHLLDVHILKRKNLTSKVKLKNYKCGACKEILSTKHGFERHKKNVHFDIFEFLCEHCSSPFRDRSTLNKHLVKAHDAEITKKEPLACETCLIFFPTERGLEKHKAFCGRKNIEEEKFEIVVEASEKILDPFEVVGEDFIESDFDDESFSCDENQKFFECKIDDLDFSPGIKFKEQLISVEPVSLECFKLEEVETQLPTPNFHLPMDQNSSFTSNPQITQDSPPSTSHEPPKLPSEPEVDEKLLQQIFVGETFKRFEKLFECTICSRTFEKLFDLKLHCVVEHRIKKFKCIHCRRSFDSRNDFRQHWSREHPRESYLGSLFVRNYAIPNESHACPHCCKVLSQRESLKRHIELVHDENRPKFYCDQCALTFKDQRTLKFHILKAHSKVEDGKAIVRRRKTTKEMRCETCGEIVYGKTGLLTHQWNNHYNFKIKDKHRYHCLICGEIMNCRTTALRHHRQVHHEGKNLVRTCQACNSDFKLFADFKRHIEEDHANARICLTCGVVSATSIDFVAHMKSHRTVPECEKKLLCDLCGFRAQQKVTIELHMVRLHNGKKREYFSTCEFCGTFFSCYQTFHAHRKISCNI